MASRKSSSKRRMSLANNTVSSNNIVECSEEMSDIIKRITVMIEHQGCVVSMINMYCQDTPNVIGVMVLNNEGFPIKSNLDNTTTVQYGHTIADLVEKVNIIKGYSRKKNHVIYTHDPTLQAKSIVRDLDPTNNLTFLRLKSASHEVLVAPEENFIILVLQQNTDSGKM